MVLSTALTSCLPEGDKTLFLARVREGHDKHETIVLAVRYSDVRIGVEVPQSRSCIGCSLELKKKKTTAAIYSVVFIT